MSKKSKIKNRKGSAMILVIIAMALFLIVSITIMNQINNQIKSNSKLYKETQYKYRAEGYVDTKISTIYREISSFIDKTKTDYPRTNIALDKNEYVSYDYSEYIECYTGDKKIITAKIKVIHKKNGQVIRREIESFDTTKFQGLKLEGIFLENGVNKYKVINDVNFKIDSDFNLSYEIKGYKKDYIK